MKKRYCPECGRSVPLDARICPYCAKTIPMHEGQIEITPDAKKDKTVLIIVAVIIILFIVPIAIAATVYVYVSDMGPSTYYEMAPTIAFTKTDQSTINTMTVLYVDPSDVFWSDIELLVDGSEENYGMSGMVSEGDMIDITSIAGTGAYEISFKHNPTSTLIYRTTFNAAS